MISMLPAISTSSYHSLEVLKGIKEIEKKISTILGRTTRILKCFAFAKKAPELGLSCQAMTVVLLFKNVFIGN